MSRPRRRSALLGISAIALSAGLAGCEQEQKVTEQPMTVYASKAECAQTEDAAACEAAYEKALAEHDRTAPQYANREACEANFAPEVCQERQVAGGGSIFMPLMMGYMMGRMMGPGAAYPVTMDRRGAAYSGSTRVMDPDPRRAGFGAAGMPRTITAPVTSNGVLASGPTRRGGFGQTASYRGSAGS